MAQRRPAAVTTVGILSIVFGSLMPIYICCGVVGKLMARAALIAFIKQPLPSTPNDYQIDFLNRELPGYQAITNTLLIVSLLLGFVLVAAGIGLLNGADWARVTGVVVSILQNSLSLAGLVYLVFFVMPAAKRWEVDFLQRNPGYKVANGPFAYDDHSLSLVVQVVFFLVGIAYAIVLLWVMGRPRVAAWFGARRAFAEVEDRHFRRDLDYSDEPRFDWNEENRGRYRRKADD